MEALTSAAADTYEAWSAVGADRTRRGDFRAALEAYGRAAEFARTETDPAKKDGAALNLAMVRIQLGEAKRGEEGLREIFLRTADPRLGFTAAYHLASSLRKQGRYEKALGYARRAMERALVLDAPDLLAPAHNLLGNLLLNGNYLDEAVEEYGVALRLWETQTCDTRYLRAILEENLGYCLLLKKDYDGGRNRILRALTLAQEIGDRRCRAECLQDLCYAALLEGDTAEAAIRGEEALAEAAGAGFGDIEENCHYLLGEIGSRTGNSERRDRHFGHLQKLHPELPFLEDFLCAVDVTGIITLKR